ncbi:hypothetical protein R3P38DRAFT_3214357 [Favolaschia claudopus]|uniref:Uncharacterized protein n=1 Tax=Favolaschia claudopus TaxID=2862362 RepID=A0AAW0ACB2_9AGAR
MCGPVDESKSESLSQRRAKFRNQKFLGLAVVSYRYKSVFTFPAHPAQRRQCVRGGGKRKADFGSLIRSILSSGPKARNSLPPNFLDNIDGGGNDSIASRTKRRAGKYARLAVTTSLTHPQPLVLRSAEATSSPSTKKNRTSTLNSSSLDLLFVLLLTRLCLASRWVTADWARLDLDLLFLKPEVLCSRLKVSDVSLQPENGQLTEYGEHSGPFASQFGFLADPPVSSAAVHSRLLSIARKSSTQMVLRLSLFAIRSRMCSRTRRCKPPEEDGCFLPPTLHFKLEVNASIRSLIDTPRLSSLNASSDLPSYSGGSPLIRVRVTLAEPFTLLYRRVICDDSETMSLNTGGWFVWFDGFVVHSPMTSKYPCWGR